MSKKNHKKNRKIGTYALASALVLSNLALVSPTSAASYKPGDLASKVQQLRQLEQSQSVKNTLKSKAAEARANLKATDKVRVIVEVDGQTPVEYATKEGKLFKDLSADKKAELFAKVESQQNSVKAKLQSKGIGINYKQNFSTAFNGFSGEVAYGDVAKIEATAGVTNVYLANEYNRPVSVPSTPDLTKSHQFIQSKETWRDTGYNGQGMVISIIDTGIDYDHRDFKVTDPTKEDLTKAKVDALVQDKGLPGHFFTDKVPYGYNYYDHNDIVKDLGPTKSMHGMHVAGITAANGDESNGGVKGVAPEAQVLAMKVFSNDPNYASTWSDVYLAAIDDSIKLGADVLNMSLGSVASFYDENSAEDVAITRAVDNGVVCATSSGNSDHIGYGFADPLAQNPDIGVTGSPGLNKDTISVAASGNEAYLYQHLLSVDGDASFSALGKGIDDWTKLAADHGGNLDLVALPAGKKGNPEDYQGIDVKGKVVVVERGTLTFADKTKYAAQAGAAGIIVWNTTNGVQYADQGGWEVPMMLVNSLAEGQALVNTINAGHNVLHVQQTDKQESPEMGRMTAFTSWGVTPELGLKPEITAPGGNILSTINDNKYEVMSGTSMASPHVAGGSALVQEYLQHDTRFSQLSVSERTHLAKVLLMNTAKVINDLDGHPYSPRRQGAGMMQIENAVTTPVYFVNKSTGEAKVELKDFQSKQFTMTFTAKNISTKNAMYKVDTTALTDEFYQVASGSDRNALQTGELKGAVIDAPDSVIVPAGQSVDFTVKVDLSNAKITGFDKAGNEVQIPLHDNIFVEGSVNLIGSYGNPNLTAPYVGFYGKWDSPQIVDGFSDLGETNDFYNLSKLFKGGHDMTRDDGTFLAPIPGKNGYALSPNGDKYDDSINPVPSFLRNAAEVQYNILDKNGKLMRRVNTSAAVVKDAYNNGNGSFYHFSDNTSWDGKVSGKSVPDGQYYYEIKSVIDYTGAQWQSKKIPVYVDTTAPKVQATYDPDKKVVSWTASDDGTGVKSYSVWVNGVKVGTVDNQTNSFDLSSAADKSVVEVVAEDYAGNMAEDTAAIGDVQLPAVYITDGTKDSTGAYNANSPSEHSAYTSFEVPVKGFVTDDIGIKTVKVNGQEVPTKFDDKTGHYNYDTTVTFTKEGLNTVQVEATDLANKKFSIARHVYVDATPSVITTDAPDRVNKNVDEVTFNVNLQDNLGYMDFYVNDNHEFETPFISEVDVLKPLNKDLQVTVPLQEGENTITLKAVDLSGNVTTKEVVINRADEILNGWVQEEDGTVYYYDEDGSKHKGWLTDGSEEDGWYFKYYFDPDTGAMHTGWLDLDGNRYYFDEFGTMATDVAYVQEAKNFFYFDEDGVLQSGFQEMYGERAYFDAESGLLRGGWKNVDGTWIYADSTGLLHTGWLNIANKWYYFNLDGEMQTGKIKDGKSTYYLKDSGEMATGWAKFDGKWYFFNSQGAMVTGWVKDGRTWYYLDKTGAMKTGWLLDGGKWYFLNSNGSMFNSGWKLVGGKWYYFYSNGAMAANTTIGKDRVGKDGAWIKK